MKLLFSVPYALNELLCENLRNSLPFLHPSIKSFSVVSNDCKIEVVTQDSSCEEEVRERVLKLIEQHRPIRPRDLSRVLFDNRNATPSINEDTFQLLKHRGDLHEHTAGIFSFRGEFLRIFRLLDEKLLRFAKSIGALDIQLPITTPLSTLNQSDFFKRTPQFAQFISILNSDSEGILDFSSKIDGTDPSFRFSDYLQPPSCMCRSAICLSSYPLYENRVLQERDYESLTVFGQAFRNESSNVTTLERLYEFSMREIIFFGSKSFVAERLQGVLTMFQELMSASGISGVIQTANDPFFAENIKALQFYQLAEQSKLEIRWVNPFSTNTVSVGSINNHGTHFSKAHNIRLTDGSFATTGCVGFGYERFIFVLMSQFGMDLSSWPQALKDFFGSAE